VIQILRNHVGGAPTCAHVRVCQIFTVNFRLHPLRCPKNVRRVCGCVRNINWEKKTWQKSWLPKRRPAARAAPSDARSPARGGLSRCVAQSAADSCLEIRFQGTCDPPSPHAVTTYVGQEGRGRVASQRRGKTGGVSSLKTWRTPSAAPSSRTQKPLSSRRFNVQCTTFRVMAGSRRKHKQRLCGAHLRLGSCPHAARSPRF